MGEGEEEVEKENKELNKQEIIVLVITKLNSNLLITIPLPIYYFR